jgi:signal transduction histidine kinase
MERLPLRHRELQERLRWFVWLRWAAVAGLGATITGAVFLLHLPLPAGPLYVLLALISLYNVVCHACVDRYYRAAPEGPGALTATTLANLQISLDLAFLALFLHFAGGVENPFVFYFIFHMIIASILLSRRAAFAQATLAAALLTALVALERYGVVHHYPLGPSLAPDLSRSGYAWALLFVFATTMYISVYMATSITTRLRAREEEIVELSRAVEEKARALEESYEELARTQQLQVTYMRRTSHELRSPLAAIESMLTVILEGLAGEASPKVHELAERSVIRLRALLRTINDLLILLKSRDLHPERTMRHVNLADCAETVVEFLAPRADAKRITVEVDASLGLPTVLADPEGMEQVCMNLVDNAIKYTLDGGHVSVHAKARGGGVELVVQDTGIGVPDEELSKLFTEFFRASNAREYEEVGSGLGLTIVKSIVESHHGAIDVESHRGEGTTFRVWIPQKPPPASAAAGM